MEALLAFLVPLSIMTFALLLELVEARLLQTQRLPGQQPEPAVPDEQPPRLPQAATDADAVSTPPRRVEVEPAVATPRQGANGERSRAASRSAPTAAEPM
jgi:hypothetical protein